PTLISSLSLHDALPISLVLLPLVWLHVLSAKKAGVDDSRRRWSLSIRAPVRTFLNRSDRSPTAHSPAVARELLVSLGDVEIRPKDRKSTRLNSSHVSIS